MVIWLTDNNSTPTGGPPEFRGGSNGPWRGELGDALEGSIRAVGMIKWPRRITPGSSNQMVSIHDILPSLASIIGARVPADRPMDGVDQSAFFTGKQAKSNRESLITFIGEEIAAVRFRQYRLYPKEFIATTGNPTMTGLPGRRAEGNGYPAIFNVEADPREENNIMAVAGWVIPQYMRLIGEYRKTLEKYPNPKAVSLTDFGR